MLKMRLVFFRKAFGFGQGRLSSCRCFCFHPDFLFPPFKEKFHFWVKTVSVFQIPFEQFSLSSETDCGIALNSSNFSLDWELKSTRLCCSKNLTELIWACSSCCLSSLNCTWLTVDSIFNRKDAHTRTHIHTRTHKHTCSYHPIQKSVNIS